MGGMSAFPDNGPAGGSSSSSAVDPGCVKTCASQNQVENNSLWRVPEGYFVHAQRIFLRIWEMLSIRMANAWVFTQPGPRLGKNACRFSVWRGFGFGWSVEASFRVLRIRATDAGLWAGISVVSGDLAR